MKRVGVVIRVALLGAAFALPVSADAPLDQYKSFVSSSTTITDNFTKLVWERPLAPPLPAPPYPAAATFTDAQTHCAQFAPSGSAPGSFRLPTLKELLTIVDEEPHDEYETTQNVRRYIDRSAFPKTPAEEFWTSSSKDATHVWTVDFATGMSQTALVGDSRRVRCVRFSGP